MKILIRALYEKWIFALAILTFFILLLFIWGSTAFAPIEQETKSIRYKDAVFYLKCGPSEGQYPLRGGYVDCMLFFDSERDISLSGRIVRKTVYPSGREVSFDGQYNLTRLQSVMIKPTVHLTEEGIYNTELSLFLKDAEGNPYYPVSIIGEYAVSYALFIETATVAYGKAESLAQLAAADRYMKIGLTVLVFGMVFQGAQALREMLKQFM
ncbi:MAG: hypothetical protein QXP42_02045 [Candidatus Micrarchaeia archaeon]